MFAITFAVAKVGWISDRRAPQDSPGLALPKGALFLAGLAAMCTTIGEGGMADWSAIFLVREVGTAEALAPLGYASYSVVMVAMRLSGDAITKAIGPMRAGRLAGLAAALGTMLLVAVMLLY